MEQICEIILNLVSPQTETTLIRAIFLTFIFLSETYMCVRITHIRGTLLLQVEMWDTSAVREFSLTEHRDPNFAEFM